MVDATLTEHGRVCTKCQEWKNADQFFVDKRRKYGPSSGLFFHCKSCLSADVKGRRQKDPERFREWERGSSARRFFANGKKKRYRGLFWRLKNKFGISVEEFSAVLQRQRDACAICGREVVVAPAGRGARNSACIDHNHSTGKVRGILCQSCNTAIGLFGDDPAVLFRAAQYLQEGLGHEPSDRCGPAIS
jgi:Autographiviridae endonuclease VII